jgi:hypothetical protein
MNKNYINYVFRKHNLSSSSEALLIRANGFAYADWLIEQRDARVKKLAQKRERQREAMAERKAKAEAVEARVLKEATLQAQQREAQALKHVLEQDAIRKREEEAAKELAFKEAALEARKKEDQLFASGEAAMMRAQAQADRKKLRQEQANLARAARIQAKDTEAISQRPQQYDIVGNVRREVVRIEATCLHQGGSGNIIFNKQRQLRE